MHRLILIDRQRVVLKPGKNPAVKFVRKKGAPIVGVVVVPDDYEAILIFVKPKQDDDKKKKRKYYFEGVTYDALRAGEYDKQNQLQGREGSFITEILLPGTYEVEAHGHKSKPDVGFRNSGIRADQVKTQVVEIPEKAKPEEITITFDPKP